MYGELRDRRSYLDEPTMVGMERKSEQKWSGENLGL